jgi:hypothetical protein
LHQMAAAVPGMADFQLSTSRKLSFTRQKDLS